MHSRLMRPGLVAVAAAALLALPGAVAEAAFPGTNGLIAFERGGDILTVTAGSPHTVNSLVTGATEPAWSPDGQRLAFVQGGSVKVRAASGGDPETLDTGTSPAWSPDGTMIAYEKGTDIWAISSSGGTGLNLSNSGGAADDDDPAWSPDGEDIAFTRTIAGNADIWVMDADAGSNQAALTTAGSNESQPNYSPGGTLIAFATDRHGASQRQIYSIPTSGGTEEAITSSNADNTHPAYSPDGLRIVFARAGSGIHTADAEFTNGATTQITTGANDASPDWQAVPPTSTAPEPANVVPPRVVVFGSTGVPVVGVTLSSSIGSWTGSGFLTFTYQWKKCMPKEGPCYRILTPPAMSSIFVPTGDLIGWSLRVEVTAKNSFGESTAQSESTPAVAGNLPVNTVRPRISVAAVPPTVGQQLTVDSGAWSGLFPFTYTYEWRRCDAPGTLPSCTPIPGAVTSSYTVTEADLGVTLRVYVTASNPGGSGTAITDHTFPAIPAPRLGPSMTGAPAISGEAKLGSRLTATRGSWSGFAPIRYVTVWQRCDATLVVCKAIKSAKGLSYTVTRADLGYRIRLSVVAANPIASVRARSEATEPITLSPPKPKSRRIVGTNRADYLAGGGGDDQLFGRGGHDTLAGGAGDDRLDGGIGNDYLDAGKGDDRVVAGRGSDTVLVADGDVDRVSCGAGNDRVIADSTDIVAADCEAVTRSSPTVPPPPPGDDGEDDKP